MNTHTDKTPEDKNQSVANVVSRKQSKSGATLQFVDNRLETTKQRKLQETPHHSPQSNQPIQMVKYVSRSGRNYEVKDDIKKRRQNDG